MTTKLKFQIKKLINKLPHVFIEARSLVKVALTKDFVNCSEYKSRSGLTFQGCFALNDGELRPIKGIYYAPHPPLLIVGSRRKMAYNIDEIKEVIMDQFKFIDKHIKKISESNKWIVQYDNYNIKIYDYVKKGLLLEFPLAKEQGNLHISFVPKVNLPLKYTFVKEIKIYNHTIVFSKEVVSFEIFAFGGEAKLIFNNNKEVVNVRMYSPDHEEEEMMIYHGYLYLFTHPKPQGEEVD